MCELVTRTQVSENRVSHVKQLLEADGAKDVKATKEADGTFTVTGVFPCPDNANNNPEGS
jgi:hypothetical protein